MMVLQKLHGSNKVKDKYADIAIKIAGSVKFLIEVKAAGVVLRAHHLEQAERYAAEGNLRWVLLTNGLVWNLYHLSFDEGIEYEHAFTVDLSTDSIDNASELLALLHRQSIIRGEHEDFWKQKAALSPQSIGKALFFEDTLRMIRRQIKKQKGILVDIEDLGTAIQSLFSPEAREQMGPFKIRRKRTPRPKVKESVETASQDSSKREDNPSSSPSGGSSPIQQE